MIHRHTAAMRRSPRLFGAGHQIDRLAVRGLERKLRDQLPDPAVP
jgi:hypothetical protein